MWSVRNVDFEYECRTTAFFLSSLYHCLLICVSLVRRNEIKITNRNLGPVVSLSAAAYYQWYGNGRHRLWNTTSYICKSCCYVATFKWNLQWEKCDNRSCRNISIFLEIIHMQTFLCSYSKFYNWLSGVWKTC
jgi:hypothetical protein